MLESGRTGGRCCVSRWHAFGWNNVYILLHFCRNSAATYFEWSKPPPPNLTFQLWPVFHRILVATRFGINDVTLGRYRECEVKLVETDTDAFHRNVDAMRLQLMRTCNFVVKRWMGFLFLTLRTKDASKNQIYYGRDNPVHVRYRTSILAGLLCSGPTYPCRLKWRPGISRRYIGFS